jgi:hypothetical protein
LRGGQVAGQCSREAFDQRQQLATMSHHAPLQSSLCRSDLAQLDSVQQARKERPAASFLLNFTP